MSRPSKKKDHPTQPMGEVSHDVLDHAPIGVFRTTPEGRFLYANQALAEMYGYPAPQDLMTSVQDIAAELFADPKDPPVVTSLLANEGIVKNYECEHIRRDGSRFWASGNIRTVYADDGSISHYQGFVSDITERKMADNQWQDTFDSVPDLIALIDTNHRILRVNRSMAERLNCSPEEICGRYCFEIVHGTSAPPDFCPHSKSVCNGNTESIEVFEERLEGFFDVTTTPIYNSKGQLTGSLHVAKDITEKKQAEKAIQDSESKFRRMLSDIPAVAVQGYDMQGVTIYWNKASEILYGYTEQEALGQNLIDLIIPDEMRPQVQKEIQQMAASSEPIPSSEITLKRKDGSFVPVLSNHTLVQRHDGSLELFCIDIDLTEIKKTQHELIQAREKAEAANQAKSEFLANMSHELRTPFNGIMGMMQLLQATDLNDEQQECVNLAIKSSERFARLLSDILDVSNIEAGKVTIYSAEFSTKELLESLSGLFSAEAHQKGLTLEFFMDPDVPAQVTGDVTRVKQIMFTLVGNALKFTEQGKVQVNLISLPGAKGGDVRIKFSISDTGIGIPDDKMRNLFKPFVQVDGSYTRKYQGAGLGLSLVNRLAELMNGNVAVESEVGRGTTVHVVLPFTLPAVDHLESVTAATTKRESKKYLDILLAEDDSLNQLVVKTMLEKQGHNVVLANNGQEAVDLFLEQDFDCILMDIQMPVMTGVEATQRIRAAEDRDQKSETINQKPTVGERISEPLNSSIPQSPNSEVPKSPNPRIPIIAVTAHTQPGDREKFLEAGMDDYLAKPVQKEDLENVLTKHCG